VGPDEHLSELDKVAVLLVVDLDHTPWVAATAHLAAFWRLYLGVGANDSERHLGHDLGVLRNGLFVIQLVAGTVEDLDVVVMDVSEDL